MLKSKILGNIFSLGMLQIANYIFPFLTIPYLSRVLSVDHYGLILFSLSFTAYFGLLCDYGFNLTATRDIATSSSNIDKLSEIVSSVTAIKVILFIFAVACNLIIVFSIAKFRANWVIYLLNIFALIGNVFFPAWFFQGMEKMRFITVIQVFVRLLFVISIFIFIHRDEQYYYWAVINLSTGLISAIISQAVLIKYFNIKYKFPNINSIKQQLINGWYVFISTIAVSLYTISNTFFLGALTTTAMVAYYASAEKFINATQSLLSVVTQSLFPHVSKVIDKDKFEGVKLLQRIFYKLAIISFIFSLGLFVCAPFIVKLMFGSNYAVATTKVLRILSALPFIICISNIFGIQTMIPFGMNKQFSKILIVSSIVNVIFTLLLVPKYSYIGTAISVVTTEMLVTIIMWYYLSKSGINLFYGEINCK